ncbi:hypothetical protein Syun_001566 [Stephania yunnanensis]|uniref:Pentatricopeptide repeat-containing protein n=1 Tax=Stephania yunnanensis TaxID=152371 RepID=A0AAP0LEC8_9MAGN
MNPISSRPCISNHTISLAILKTPSSRSLFSSPKRGEWGHNRRLLTWLVRTRAKAKEVVLGTPSVAVEKGKYSYDVETLINKLSSHCRDRERERERDSLQNYTYILNNSYLDFSSCTTTLGENWTSRAYGVKTRVRRFRQRTIQVSCESFGITSSKSQFFIASFVLIFRAIFSLEESIFEEYEQIDLRFKWLLTENVFIRVCEIADRDWGLKSPASYCRLSPPVAASYCRFLLLVVVSHQSCLPHDTETYPPFASHSAPTFVCAKRRARLHFVVPSSSPRLHFVVVVAGHPLPSSSSSLVLASPPCSSPWSSCISLVIVLVLHRGSSLASRRLAGRPASRLLLLSHRASSSRISRSVAGRLASRLLLSHLADSLVVPHRASSSRIAPPPLASPGRWSSRIALLLSHLADSLVVPHRASSLCISGRWSAPLSLGRRRQLPGRRRAWSAVAPALPGACLPVGKKNISSYLHVTNLRASTFMIDLKNPSSLSSPISSKSTTVNQLSAFFHEYQQQMGFKRDYPSYAAVVYKLSRRRHFEVLQTFLDHIRDNNIRCQETIFIAVMQHYGDCGLSDRAIQLFKQIPSSIAIDQNSHSIASSMFNTVKNFAGTGKEFAGTGKERVYYWLRNLKHGILQEPAKNFICNIHGRKTAICLKKYRKDPPTVVTYNTLIGFLCKKGDMEKAFR